MTLIGRKKSKGPLEQVLRYLQIVVKLLVAQRVARNAYKGHQWARRLPMILVGLAIVAFIVKKSQSGGSPAGGAPTTT